MRRKIYFHSHISHFLLIQPRSIESSFLFTPCLSNSSYSSYSCQASMQLLSNESPWQKSCVPLMKYQYDAKHKARFLKVGDWVALRLHKGYNVPGLKNRHVKIEHAPPPASSTANYNIHRNWRTTRFPSFTPSNRALSLLLLLPFPISLVVNLIIKILVTILQWYYSLSIFPFLLSTLLHFVPESLRKPYNKKTKKTLNLKSSSS